MGYSLEHRILYLEGKKVEYPITTKTEYGTFRPEKVYSDTKLVFVYIPFSERNHCVWLFKTVRDRNLFEEYIAEQYRKAKEE